MCMKRWRLLVFFFDGILVNFVLQELGECSFILQFITALTICDRFARKHSLVTLFSERKESRAGASKVTSNKSHNSQSLPLDKNRNPPLVVPSIFREFEIHFFLSRSSLPLIGEEIRDFGEREEIRGFFLLWQRDSKKKILLQSNSTSVSIFCSLRFFFFFVILYERQEREKFYRVRWSRVLSLSLSLSCSWRHVSRNDVEGTDICILLPPWGIQQDKSALICLSFCFCMLHACMQ